MISPTHVVIFFVDEENKKIYLVEKDVSHKPHMSHLHLKLNGFGGGIEESDANEYSAAKREINEELELDLDEFEVIKQGIFITSKGVVAVFRAKCNNSNITKLKVGYIKGEGEANWYDFNYILQHPSLIPIAYDELYQKLFTNEINFSLDLGN